MSENKIDFAVSDDDGNGVAARIFLFIRRADAEVADPLMGMSDQSGWVSFVLPPRAVFECLVARAPGYWTAYCDDIADCVPITMRRLPDVVEPAWWLNCLGIDTSRSKRGANIKIGVVDTGFSKGDGIRHVHEIGGARQQGGDEFEPGHGELVCRVLGDRSKKARRWMSAAPGAQIFFADATHSDEPEKVSALGAAIAINKLLDAKVDLINLSWGEPFEDDRVLDAIKAADELGVAVVAASGNDPNDQQVYFPARHESCIAVTAFGKTGWGEAGSVVAYDQKHSRMVGKAPSGDAIYFWCNSTCGVDVNGTAPGAGILVQRKNEIYAALSGTSFAAPLACGALAVALAQDKEYLDMPRSKDRTQHARSVFLKMCVSVGLDYSSQGYGSPFAAGGR
ncbi:S8/S53 family peptidase [Bradyrhizobium cosmicum]|uniref:S8 family peptidase n=1 Tax=Bradyrhizobium cosmicum TaxID=1404864 RepID=UPI0028E2B6B7|nr:S8/S53 family peptidase [Bradyrhizobium cosmicum]